MNSRVGAFCGEAAAQAGWDGRSCSRRGVQPRLLHVFHAGLSGLGHFIDTPFLFPVAVTYPPVLSQLLSTCPGEMRIGNPCVRNYIVRY
jgi:hypothetical protein